uniref:Topless-related protein 4-like n=1 Tax=Tanacetum cinerariifolium TaxID=118510 RepID=A0A6L2JUY4_TANCI|nr:topless-related protein 4-like [Tanacetum cinerariifolium]
MKRVAPCIRFNKEGIIMVVSTKENGITILANLNEIGLLQTMEICRSFNPSRVEEECLDQTITADTATEGVVGLGCCRKSIRLKEVIIGMRSVWFISLTRRNYVRSGLQMCFTSVCVYESFDFSSDWSSKGEAVEMRINIGTVKFNYDENVTMMQQPQQVKEFHIWPGHTCHYTEGSNLLEQRLTQAQVWENLADT